MTASSGSPVTEVDVRGPRFVAWVTTAVLVVTLLVSTVSSAAAAVVLAVQGVAFAVGAAAGPRAHPYGRVYAAVVAPRLGPVTEKEPSAPLRFAQGVGLVFAIVGVIGFAAGWELLGIVATAGALFAAILNAAFGICLGCKIYPLVTRFRSPATGSSPA